MIQRVGTSFRLADFQNLSSADDRENKRGTSVQFILSISRGSTYYITLNLGRLISFIHRRENSSQLLYSEHDVRSQDSECSFTLPTFRDLPFTSDCGSPLSPAGSVVVVTIIALSTSTRGSPIRRIRQRYYIFFLYVGPHLDEVDRRLWWASWLIKSLHLEKDKVGVSNCHFHGEDPDRDGEYCNDSRSLRLSRELIMVFLPGCMSRKEGTLID